MRTCPLRQSCQIRGADDFETNDDDDGSRSDPSAAEAARKRGREDEVDSETKSEEDDHGRARQQLGREYPGKL